MLRSSERHGGEGEGGKVGGVEGGGEGCPGDDQMLRCISPNNQRETIFGQNGGTGYR